MDVMKAYKQIRYVTANGGIVYHRAGYGYLTLIADVKEPDPQHSLLTLITVDHSTVTIPADNYELQEAMGQLQICPVGMKVCPDAECRRCLASFGAFCVADTCHGQISSTGRYPATEEIAKQMYEMSVKAFLESFGPDDVGTNTQE